MSDTYSVYVLSSKKIRRLYVGMSSNVQERVDQHNTGEVFSTKGYRPWVLVYVEEIGDRRLAREREKYLKSGCGKELLKALIFKQ